MLLMYFEKRTVEPVDCFANGGFTLCNERTGVFAFRHTLNDYPCPLSSHTEDIGVPEEEQ